MLTSQQLFARLDDLGLAHSTVEHAPVYTVEEAKQHRGVLPGHRRSGTSSCAKQSKEAMWLVVAIEDHAIDLKQLGERLGAGRLSFGSPERLRKYLGVEPGSVTPFSVIDEGHRQAPCTRCSMPASGPAGRSTPIRSPTP